MRQSLIKRRIARLMAFVLIFLMMAQPFSDVYIYADEDTEDAVSDIQDETEESARKAIERDDQIEEGIEEFSGNEDIVDHADREHLEITEEAAGDVEVEVEFNLNGGSWDRATIIRIPSGNTVTEPDDIPVKDGFVFFRWNDSLGNKYNFNNPVYGPEKVIITASWKEAVTVTYNYNDGITSANRIKVAVGEPIPKPQDPTRSGFKFKYWYSNDPSAAYVFGNAQSGVDVNLTAKWIEEYTVSFDATGGKSYINNATFDDGVTTVKSYQYEKGDSILSAPDDIPRRAGYKFLGWDKYKGIEGEIQTPVVYPYVVNSDEIFYAKWEPLVYTVSYISCGKLVKTITQNSQQSFTAPILPSREDEGYEFKNWSENPDAAVGDKSGSWFVDNNKIYYAIWKLIYHEVRFASNVHNKYIDPITVSHNSLIKAPTKFSNGSDIENTGYVIEGWYTDNNVFSNKWDFENDKVSQDGIVLYPHWVDKYLKISFDTRGGTPAAIASQNVIYNGHVERPDDPSKDNFVFGGWYSDYLLTDEFDFNSPVKEDITLHAKWNPAVWVELYGDGGKFTSTGTDEKKSWVQTGSSIDKLEHPQRDGHTFDKWTLSDGSLPKTIISENVSLHANWNINYYDVTFVTNDGSNVPSQNVIYGGKITKPDDPEKTGYNFSGWFSDPELNTIWDFDNDVVEDTTTLYAKWVEKTYRVSFNLMEAGTEGTSVSYLSVSYNHTFNKSDINAVWLGHEVSKWYKDKKRSIEWDFEKDVVTGDTILYANWVAKEYTVTFKYNDDGETADYKKKVYYGGKIIPPADPSREGYSFKGWKDELGIFVSDFKQITVTDNRVFSADWEEKSAISVIAYSKGNGKITPAGSNIKIPWGGSRVFTLEPDDGYQIESLSDNGKEVSVIDNKYTLENVKETHTLIASFSKKPDIKPTKYIISASCADSNGKISPSGKVSVLEGDDRAFQITPNSGFEVDKVLLDGKSIEVSENYLVITNVRSNHILVVYFKKLSDKPIVPEGYALVEFIVDNESYNTEIVSLGQIVKRPADPEKSGLIFMGWYDGNWKWNFSDPVEKDLTLVARFISQTVSKDDVHSGMDRLMDLSDPDNITMVKGQSYDFGKGTWSSSNKQVITVKKSTGVAKAKSPSNVPVTLTNTAVNPNVQYKIKVVAPELSAKKLTMGVGSTTKISVLYSGGLNIAWTSSNPKVASVEEGRITTIAKGKTNINAYLNGMKYTCKVTVSDKYTAPSSFDDVYAFTLRPAQTLDLKKIAVEGVKPNKLDWRLSDESGTKDMDKSGWLAWDDGVVRVNVNGKLKAKSCGTSTLIGKRGDTRVKTIKVTVDTIPSKTETYINVGKNEKLKYFKVNNKKAQWSATNEGTIVLLGSTGKTMGTVYGLNVGSSVVSCSYNGMEYSTKVHVEDPDLSTEDSRLGRTGNNEYLLTLKTGTRFVIDLPDVSQHIAWKSKDKKIAFVDENGIIEGRKTGKTYVSAKINGTNVKIKVFVTQ